MNRSARRLKILLRIYPPFLFQRIVVRELAADFSYMKVEIRRSCLTRNLEGSTFGGTIFSATDPLYALLLSACLQTNGVRHQVWLRQALIHYLKPLRSAGTIEVQLPREVIDQAIAELKSGNKFTHTFPIQVIDAEGEVCAEVSNEVYARPL